MVNTALIVTEGGFLLVSVAALCLSWTIGLFVSSLILGDTLTQLHHRTLDNFCNLPLYVWNQFSPLLAFPVVAFIEWVGKILRAHEQALKDASRAQGPFYPLLLVLPCATITFLFLMKAILKARGKGLAAAAHQDIPKKQK